MQIVSNGDNLHEMSNLFSGENQKVLSPICHQLNEPREW